MMFFSNVRVQGTEMEIPGIYITGHPPTPPGQVYTVAIVAAIVLFIAAGILQYFLNKKYVDGQWENCRFKPLKSRTFRLVTGILGIIAFYFISLEAVLQIFVFFHPYQQFIPDPQSHWKINPGIKKLQETRTERNAHQVAIDDGVIDWEYGRDKPQGAYRILCYGDSQTMGTPWVGNNIMFTYPKQVQSQLRDELGNENIQVINMGVSGYSSFQGLIFFKNIGLLYHPDCVIVGYGHHDGAPSYAEDKEITSASPLVKKFRGLVYQSQLYLLIRKKVLEKKADEKMENGHQVFRRVSKEDYIGNLKAFADECRKRNILVVFFVVPQEAPDGTYHPEYADYMRQAARELNAPIIDGAANLAKLPQEQQNRYFVADKVHFTQEGCSYLADLVIKSITGDIAADMKKKGIPTQTESTK
ncbi:MAG: SGNH/GDSL hydrolase family protein [Firmicutes bacterium]|nr:SGNH/GDSL hydrolase family protein [Bacillota bacterium]